LYNTVANVFLTALRAMIESAQLVAGKLPRDRAGAVTDMSKFVDPATGEPVLPRP
jgi:hypothetical protein